MKERLADVEQFKPNCRYLPLFFNTKPARRVEGKFQTCLLWYITRFSEKCMCSMESKIKLGYEGHSVNSSVTSNITATNEK